MAHKRLQDNIRTTPIVFDIIGAEFEMDTLQHIYELIQEKKYEGKYFMNKMEESQMLIKRKIGRSEK